VRGILDTKDIIQMDKEVLGKLLQFITSVGVP
jgi:hypothetical protein